MTGRSNTARAVQMNDGKLFAKVRAARNVSYLVLRALSGTEGEFEGENVAGVSLRRAIGG